MKKDKEKAKKKRGRGPGRGGPMQVTASSGYAIHGLGYLAWKKARKVIFLSEIAEYFAIPTSYLAKVFQALARAGLVVSYRGAKGGYALAREAGEITFRAVIEVFEGPVSEVCTLNSGPCTKRMACTVSRRLAEAQRSFLEALSKYTITDIAQELARADAAARRAARG
ncbi:MAG: Rrf2 family transcriptional regulator [Planctomycetes bacterium]|jgi:Rrf2 family protein|nr:Rrf2 family transcriptional regulator [Planctomycetota bacterium]